MSYTVIKTIGGRQYRYLQKSYRSGGKVRTKSVYLGPVDGGKRKRKLDFRGLAPDLVALVIQVAKHGTKSPAYKTKYHLPDQRTLKHLRETVRQASGKLRAEMTERERVASQAWSRETSQMSREEWERQVALMKAERSAQELERAPAPKSQEEKLKDSLAAAHEARHTAYNTQSPEAAAPVKDFTVDNEIEARQATFDKAVDEYNVGTAAAEDTPAPADAPTAEPDFASGASPDGQGQQGGPGADAGPSSSDGQK